jgi:hypothetical protein
MTPKSRFLSKFQIIKLLFINLKLLKSLKLIKYMIKISLLIKVLKVKHIYLFFFLWQNFTTWWVYFFQKFKKKPKENFMISRDFFAIFWNKNN